MQKFRINIIFLIDHIVSRIAIKLLYNLWGIGYRIIDHLVPKIDNLVVFSQQRERYFDNGRIFYEYLSSDPAWQAVWLANNGRVRSKIQCSNKSLNVVLKYSFSGFYNALRAKYVVYTYSSRDLGFYKFQSKKTITVQLWHAITIKGYGALDNKLDKKRLKKYLKKETHFYDLIISSSLIDRHTTALCNGTNIRKVVVTGLPRNDLLYYHGQSNLIFELVHSIREKLKEHRIILYAPTFRDEGVADFFPFDDFNLLEVEKFLVEKNAYLLIRPHQNDIKNQEIIRSYALRENSRILLAGNNEAPNVISLLPFVDVIVTDYSSIYVDLLLLDIPPVFIPYDLEIYQKNRGLAYDYSLITPGPKVFNQRDFLSAISDGFEGAPSYKKHRFFVKKMFHEYQDGQACKRIATEMQKLRNQ